MTNPARTVGGKWDLFGHVDQAKMYREFRPEYPVAMVESILREVPEQCRGSYVDVACGSGQLTRLIAPKFKETVAIDQSFEQLSQAEPIENVKFVPGSAFDLPVPSGSVDLLTVAQALHWLVPYGEFFNEVRRVLKPGGMFATAAYAFPQLSNAAANASVGEFYFDLLGAHKSPGSPGCWWETNRPTIDGYYSDIPFPSASQTHKFTETVTMPIEKYVNYLRTLSAYRTLLRAGEPDPLPALETKIVAAYGAEDNKGDIEVRIPFFYVTFKNVV